MNPSQSNGIQSRISFSTLAILKAAGVILGLYFLYVIRDILLLLLISIILASALTPLVEWLYSRLRFPRGLTVVLVYVIFIGFVVLAISYILPQLIAEAVSLGHNINTFRDQFQEQGSAFYSTFEQFGLSDSLKSIGTALAGITTNIFQTTLGVFTGLIDTITVLVISFYLVIEQNAMKDFVKSLTPAHYHARLSNVVYKVQVKMGRWLLGQLALMAAIFILTYIGLSVLGIEYALALALLAGLLEIVPYLGPIISAVPAVFVGFLHSPLQAGVVIILYIVVQQLESYLLAPRIIGRSIGSNPLAVLLAILVGFNIAGILGMLIAAPIVAIATVVIQDLSEHKKSHEERMQQLI